jgi:hypothetical protein
MYRKINGSDGEETNIEDIIQSRNIRRNFKSGMQLDLFRATLHIYLYKVVKIGTKFSEKVY